MDFNVIEASDAIRLTFNAWPHSKLEATRCVLPLAAMYTPNKVLPSMPVSPFAGFLGLDPLSPGSRDDRRRLEAGRRARVLQDGGAKGAPRPPPPSAAAADDRPPRAPCLFYTSPTPRD